ncbi:MAG: hypothetical protein GXP53_05945 [Deltaproteobacteria bacterium]|nr:hypothetical protein [Deltaproteobacteria bacterium]
MRRISLLAFSVCIFLFLTSAVRAVEGDFTGNGKLDMGDAIHILQQLAGIENGDADADGTPDYQDGCPSDPLKVDPGDCGCGNAETDTDGDGIADCIDTVDNTELEDVINQMSESLVDAGEMAQGATAVTALIDCLELDTVLDATSLTDLVAKIYAVRNQICAAMERAGNVFTITMTAEDNCCNNTVGVIIITPGYGDDGPYFNMQFNNVRTTDCTIDGAATIRAKVVGSELTSTMIATDLTLCGNKLNGTLTAKFHLPDYTLTQAVLDATMSYTVTVGEGQEAQNVPVTVVADNLVYEPVTGGGEFNGNLSINWDGEVYNMVLTDLVISNVCGIPISGAMLLNGEITFDFSNTTCESPTVDVSIGGITVTMSLEDAAEAFS